MRTNPALYLAVGAAFAIGATLVPSAAFAAEGDVTISGDTYTEVIFDHAINGFDGEKWTASCPAEYPYLWSDGTVDWRLGSGLRMTEETPSATDVVAGDGFMTWNETTERLGNGLRVVTGMDGTASNWSLVRQHLKLEMTCTNNLSKAWLLR